MELFKPSNSTEGDIFREDWCSKCQNDSKDSPCEIINLTMIFDTTDKEYPKAWRHEEDKPICAKFLHIDDEAIPYRCTKTMDMFPITQEAMA